MSEPSFAWDFDRLEADVMDPAAGSDPGPEFRIGKYIVGPELARGAMGVVHQGEDTELKRPVAVKILRDVAGSSPVIRQRFQREAQAAAMLVHPNVVRVYDAGEDAGRMYMVMELVDGHPLSKVMGGARGDLPSVLRLLEKAARGVAAAHEKRIVHRDVKPANILITQAGEPKVGDFGLAHLMDAEVSLTQTGLPMGTPTYMAPEQVRGETKKISPATDVYSLGAILYEILTGRTPHDGDTSVEIYKRILETDPEPPRRRDSRLPRDLETIALKALERDPQQRYPDAGAFADDLARHLAGEPIQAKPLPLSSQVWRKGVRHRRSILPVLAVLLFLAGWGVVSARQRAAKVHAAMAAAADLERREKLVEARAQYQVALDADPACAEALKGVTRVSDRMLALETARTETLKDLEVARPALDRAEWNSFRADGSFDDTERRVKEARKSISRAIDRAPDPGSAAMAWDLDGRAWDLLGLERPAEASWRKAISLDPKLGAPHFFVARILIARAFLRRASDPNEAIRLATEAKRELEAARENGSGYDNDLQRDAAEATLALAKQEAEAARTICRDSLGRHGSEPGTETLHWILGQVAPTAEEAFEEYSAAIRVRPHYGMALLCRGMHTYFVRHDLAQAFADLDAALKSNPNFAAAFNTRGDISYREKDFVSAEADFTAMIRLDKDDAGGYFNRGNARVAQGRFEEGAADYSEAIRLRPEWDAARYYRGRARSGAGDVKGALEDFEQTLKVSPGWVDVNVDRALLRERTGDRSGAIADLEQALKAAPADWERRQVVESLLQQLKNSKPRDF